MAQERGVDVKEDERGISDAAIVGILGSRPKTSGMEGDDTSSQYTFSLDTRQDGP